MGKLFNKLDHTNELGAWITYYNGIENNPSSKAKPADLEFLMRFWETNKGKYLYDLLDKKFIFEKEISFEQPVSVLADRMYEELSNTEMSEFHRNFINWVDDLESVGRITWRQAANLKYLIRSRVLAENKYEGELIRLTIDGTCITIQPGCKPTKILRKIAETAGIEGFERFRIAHSKVLAEKSQKGTLCLSIHPLDYLTMSDNTYNWDSCMNWRDAGCYRIGTVEMMNSPCVVVAYVKGKETMRYGEFGWNSKKWRNLFIVTKDFICGIKGYPYQSSKFDEVCVETLRDLAEKNLGFSYCEDIVEHQFDYQTERVFIEELDKDVKFKFETIYMYPDFGNSNTSHLIVSKHIPDVVKCNYSGQPICMFCGEELSSENYDSHDCSFVICEDCIPIVRCENCEERMNEDDAFELDGITLCSDCYWNHRVYDPFDDEYHWDGYMTKVYLVSNKIIEKNHCNRDTVFYRYANFERIFPHVNVYNTTYDRLPIELHHFPYRGYFEDACVYIIDLDKVNDDSLRAELIETFNDYGE